MPDPKPDAPGTLFPALSDDNLASTPGGQAGPSDISGLVLPDLSEGDSSFAQSGASAGTPGAPAAKDDKEAERVAADDLGVVAKRGKGRSFQERIDQLTRKAYQARDENTALAAQIQQLTGMIAQQQQQILHLTRGGIAGPPAPVAQPSKASGDPLDALLSGGAPASQPAPATQPAQVDIAQVVDQAIRRYDTEQRGQFAQFEQLRRAQEVSFEEACEVLPGLRDNRTLARQTFNKIFDSSPMRGEPDAPFQIALQVKGLLADEIATRKAPTGASREEAKRQASVVVPQPSVTDAPGGNRPALQKAYDEAMAKIRSGDNSFATFKQARVYREMLKRQG